MYLQAPRSARKAMSDSGTLHLFASQLWKLLYPLMGYQNVDRQLFLQKKNVLTWNQQRIEFCSLKPCRASPRMASVGEHFYRGGKDLGRAIVNSVCDLSLAESLPGKKSCRVQELPLLVS